MDKISTKKTKKRRTLLISTLPKLESVNDYLSFAKTLSWEDRRFLHLPENNSYLDAALMLCVRDVKVKNVEKLLEMGANPNCVDSDGIPCLSWLVIVKDTTQKSTLQKIKVAELLVEYGGDLNQKCDFINATPFLYAAADGPFELMVAYARLGAYIYATDSHGRNALMLVQLGVSSLKKKKEEYLIRIDTNGRFLKMKDKYGRNVEWYRQIPRIMDERTYKKYGEKWRKCIC